MTPEPNTITPTPSTTTRTRSVFSEKRIADLELAARITDTALSTSHAAKLAEHEIAMTFVQALAADVALCRTSIARLLTQTSERTVQTETESDWRTQIEQSISTVQAAARQKYVGDPHRAERLRPYAIGEDIAKQSRAALTQTTTNILAALATDALPGITPAKVAALQSALDSWIATDRAQGGAGETVLQTRKQINDLLGTIATRRQTLQFAADAAYPSRNSSNAETRALFGLPRTRPYSPKL
ncbi:hypothetical protein [Armatimonas sp.]|uniref:hypothetical protein n=1 Tax=Armatimonas sp. TaxID=1872638 RepID=UPI00286BB67A|nr:hypothetical protein [Armatimonas sp.]